MISTRHEVFMEVANCLSFGKASQVLCISQPAISKHIKALERQYNVTLFDRRGHSIALSEAGRLLFNRVAEAKTIQARLDYELSTLQDAFRAKGLLKLGASTTVALYILPKILSSFHQKYPDVKISLLNRNTETIIQALQDGEIDLGIVEVKSKSSTLMYQPFLSDEVVAVCSSRSPLADRKSIEVSDLPNYPIVLREQGSGTLAALKGALARHKIKLSDLNVGVRLSGTEALKNFLKEDDSLGFLSRRSLLRELQDGELTVITINKLPIRRDFFFIQRQGATPIGINRTFTAFAQKFHNQKL